MLGRVSFASAPADELLRPDDRIQIRSLPAYTMPGGKSGRSLASWPGSSSVSERGDDGRIRPYSKYVQDPSPSYITPQNYPSRRGKMEGQIILPLL